jgi:hypothetical protein
MRPLLSSLQHAYGPTVQQRHDRLRSEKAPEHAVAYRGGTAPLDVPEDDDAGVIVEEFRTSRAMSKLFPGFSLRNHNNCAFLPNPKAFFEPCAYLGDREGASGMTSSSAPPAMRSPVR